MSLKHWQWPCATQRRSPRMVSGITLRMSIASPQLCPWWDCAPGHVFLGCVWPGHRQCAYGAYRPSVFQLAAHHKTGEMT